MSRKPRKTPGKQPSEEAVKQIEDLAQSLGMETFWNALNALEPKLKRSRGRPKGSGRDWAPLLERMADLICSGKAKDRGEAARLVAAEEPGHSFESTRKQLNDNFRNSEMALVKAGTQRWKASLKRLFPTRAKAFRFPKRTRFEEIIEAAQLTTVSRAFAERRDAALDGKEGEEYPKALLAFLETTVGQYYYDYCEVLQQAHELYGNTLWYQFGGSMLDFVSVLAESYELLTAEEGQENKSAL